MRGRVWSKIRPAPMPRVQDIEANVHPMGSLYSVSRSQITADVPQVQDRVHQAQVRQGAVVQVVHSSDPIAIAPETLMRSTPSHPSHPIVNRVLAIYPKRPSLPLRQVAASPNYALRVLQVLFRRLLGLHRLMVAIVKRVAARVSLVVRVGRRSAPNHLRLQSGIKHETHLLVPRARKVGVSSQRCFLPPRQVQDLAVPMGHSSKLRLGSRVNTLLD